MKKILVTTDFSSNSRKAIRFAMQLASQNNYKLIFYNVTDVMKKLSIWDNIYYSDYESRERKKSQEKLEKLVARIEKASNFSNLNYECVCELNSNPLLNVSKQIISFAENVKANYICVSTRGAGTIDKLFGTIASALILKSTVPLFVIPKNYKISSLTKILYASDVDNIDLEMKKVAEFGASLKAKIFILHYDYDNYLKQNKEKLEKIAKKHESEDITFQYKKLNPKYTINYHIKKDVMLLKASLVVLFTKQNRKWFDRLFATHHATNMSFNTKVPLLIFRKKEK